MNWRDLFAKRTDDFTPVSETHLKRQKLFATYWNYYRGHHKRFIKADAGKPDDNVILNYAGAIVDQSIDFLFGKELVFEIDSNTVGRNPQEQYLDLVWGEAESKMSFLQEVAQNGAVCGSPFIRLYRPDPNVRDSLPQLVNLDPSLVDVITADDNVEDIRAFHIVWRVGEVWKRHRIDHIVEGGYWLITPERAEKSRLWVQDGDEEFWEYDFAPVFMCKNLPLANSVWGMSDLENADLNDAINRTASNTNRIIRFHAHPKTVGTGFNASQLQTTSVNEFWTIDKTDAKVANLEMQSDLASSREFVADLKHALYKIASASEIDPAQVQVGALSGFALKILHAESLAKAQRKRNTYGKMLKDINKALLILANQEPQDVANVWKNPLPESGLEQAQELSMDVQNGLSQSTYLERRGYDAAQEMEKKRQEADEAMRRQQAMFVQRSPFQQAIGELENEDEA